MRRKQAIQTTVTFDTLEQAKKLKDWLILYGYDSDYGVPIFKNWRQVGSTQWCIEYQTENPSLIQGIIIGIKFN